MFVSNLQSEFVFSPGRYSTWIGKANEVRNETNALRGLLRQIANGEVEAEISMIPGSDENWIVNLANLRPDYPFTPYALTVFTSGTTGEPKPISIDIRERIRKSKRDVGRIWLLCYPLGRWSSFSILIHTLMNDEKLIVPESFSHKHLMEAMLRERVNSISLTPSLFKSLLLIDMKKLKSVNMQRVTFGGEYVSQAVLNLAREVWPNSTVTHIYASTELGELLSENDGLEGYRVSKLASLNAYLASDGELIVSGVGTRDYWEINEERMIFIGRKTEIVTVGGFNVSLIKVEKALLSIDGVEHCSVSALPSPLLGNVLVANVIGNVTRLSLRQELAKLIPKHELPSQINLVDRIDLSDSMKIKR
jgi:acyl-coenzyme A synthetase/AMP-(fatty) acid ligase